MGQVTMKNQITGETKTFNTDDWTSQQKMNEKQSQGWVKESGIAGIGNPTGSNSYFNDFANTGFKTPELNFAPPQPGEKGKNNIDDFYGGSTDSNDWNTDGTNNTGGGSTGGPYGSQAFNPNPGGGNSPVGEEFQSNFANEFDPTGLYSGDQMSDMNYNIDTSMPVQEDEEF